ncbi:MAG: BrnT family toxin [Pseudolabrys sp.]|nr:BrnT family toxin [Pseudolabrys sp.]
MADEPTFEWDPDKDRANGDKHGVRFALAQQAFFDPRRVIAEDIDHSIGEQRYFCFGEVGGGIMTVRFTWRDGRVRIFGAGYWRKGKTIYEQSNR